MTLPVVIAVDKQTAELGKAFLDRIAEGVTGLARPYQIRRVAKAESEATIIRKLGDIDASELENRARMRCEAEQLLHQQNIERIATKALPLLKAEAKPQAMDKDWIAHFFDHARLTSDDDMQELWARILAGEANDHGSFSKRTVNLVGTFDKADAEAFEALCRFGWQEPFFGRPIVTDLALDLFKKNGVTFDSLMHLEDIGLLSLGEATEYIIQLSETPGMRFRYFDRVFFVRPTVHPVNKRADINFGKVFPSKAASELSRICTVTPVEGYADYVIEYWRQHGCTVDVVNKETPN